MEEKLTLLDQAIIFAVQAHAGAQRRDGHTPYILHCTEAAAIAATLTQDQEVLAAAVLHDVIEDTDVTFKTLSDKFGPRVAGLVQDMSENKRPELPADPQGRDHLCTGTICGSCPEAAVSGRQALQPPWNRQRLHGIRR